jgi:hypothetical protein
MGFAALSGCAAIAEDEIVVVTSWGERDCRVLEAEFSRWSSSPAEALDAPTRIRWMRLAPGDDPARPRERLGAVDVILGGLSSSYQRLAEDGGLANPEVGTGPLWIVARRGAIGWAYEPAKIATIGGAPPETWDLANLGAWSGRIAVGDPRIDSTTRSLASGLLREDWIVGYATLVRLAAGARRIEMGGRSAIAAVERDRAVVAPAVAAELPPDSALRWAKAVGDFEQVEGAGMIRGSAHPERSGAFLRFLASRPGRTAPVPPAGSWRAEDLRDDMLGAVMVEAQDELWVARAALERAGWPKNRVEDLLKPPPWPPASIEKMKTKESANELLDTLAEQIAPDPYDRGWLIELWDREPGRVDGAFLEELATANGGRLGSNPRLRAWLREEWIAWARQNARRVTREAEKIQR